MMNVLQGIGYGIVAFAVIVVIGIVVLTKLGNSIADCGSNTFNATDQYCWNATHSVAAPTDTGFVTSGYLSTQLGSTGLAGWIPAVIAVAIGGLFLAYFGGKKGY